MIRLRIKEVAQAKGIGLNKLARMADLNTKSVSRIFHDPYHYISTETLDKIAQALNIDASMLLESDPPLPKTIEKEPAQ